MFHGKIGAKHAAGIVTSIAGIGFALSFTAPAQASTNHQLHEHHLRVIGAPVAAVTESSSPPSTTAASGFQACVISRESGGNASAVNPTSGAGGLYQFLPSTWAGLGLPGLPQNAPVAEQTQAFWQLYNAQGSAPWSSDGC